jgi:hypothetical protein
MTAVDHQPLTTSPLTLALGVNALTVCDCGASHFKVGIAFNPVTSNNFIRVLECLACDRQMAVVHMADSGLAPSVGGSR